MNWLLDGVVDEGTYEIFVEAHCIASGGLPDFIISRTLSSIGTFDVTAPGRFCYPSSDEVIFIEELFSLNHYSAANPLSFMYNCTV